MADAPINPLREEMLMTVAALGGSAIIGGIIAIIVVLWWEWRQDTEYYGQVYQEPEPPAPPG